MHSKVDETEDKLGCKVKEELNQEGKSEELMIKPVRLLRITRFKYINVETKRH
jgi:hypothetical protein